MKRKENEWTAWKISRKQLPVAKITDATPQGDDLLPEDQEIAWQIIVLPKKPPIVPVAEQGPLPFLCDHPQHHAKTMGNRHFSREPPKRHLKAGVRGLAIGDERLDICLGARAVVAARPQSFHFIDNVARRAEAEIVEEQLQVRYSAG